MSEKILNGVVAREEADERAVHEFLLRNRRRPLSTSSDEHERQMALSMCIYTSPLSDLFNREFALHLCELEQTLISENKNSFVKRT